MGEGLNFKILSTKLLSKVTKKAPNNIVDAAKPYLRDSSDGDALLL